jgi:hypothetical protein
MFENEWINLSVLAILIYSFVYFRQWFIIYSKMPQAVVDFPVYKSTEEEYNSLRKEIEPFFLDALENRRGELILTVKQLNCISNRGITPIKGRTISFPNYYKIDDSKLIQNELLYPSTLSIAGYLINVRVIEFTGTMCCSELISVNGFPPPSENSGTRFFPLHDLTLFIYLCDFDRKKMIELAKKITIVEIVDDKLVMRV